jgi:hypothetical protein
MFLRKQITMTYILSTQFHRRNVVFFFNVKMITQSRHIEHPNSNQAQQRRGEEKNQKTD